MQKGNESGFGSGIFIGIILMGALIIFWFYLIEPTIELKNERENSAREECYDNGLSYIDYKCKRIDLSNSTSDRGSKHIINKCYAICGYPIS